MDINVFLKKVDEVLIRHKSILDAMTKLQETSAKINRAIAKSATECGCISICAKKQEINPQVDYTQLDEYMKTQIEGELCPKCLGKMKEEIGDHIFYLASVCNILHIDLDQVTDEKYNELNTLGKFGLF